MNPPPPAAAPPPAPRPSRRPVWLAGGALALATLAAYSGTFHVPFVFDDPSSALTNASIRQLWPPWSAFSPPPLVTVSGRPVVNFTLALNHAIAGTAPWAHYRIVAQERPAEPESHFNLGIAGLRAGLRTEATAALEAALRLRSDYPEARQQLAGLRGAPLR